MQRMHPTFAGHRPTGGDQRLRRDLPAEHPDRGHRRRHPAVEVVLQSLQVEQLDQGVDHGLPAGHTVDVESHAGAVVNRFTHAAHRSGERRRSMTEPAKMRDHARQSACPSRWTRIRLVEPEVFGGAPATMTTTSPASKPGTSSIAMSTCSTMASVVCDRAG